MQLKKSASANLENKRLTYVLIGFLMSLSVVYVAFEWTEAELEVAEITDVQAEAFEENIDEIDNTLQEEPEMEKPEEIPEAVIEEIVIVDNDKQVEATDFSSEDNKESTVFTPQTTVVEVEEEDEDQIFIVVEEQPEFPGGNEALMRYFKDNVRYPVRAQEMGIQGKVICQFTVRKDGSVGDVVVLRSADPSLDQEAIRLVSKMPKWKPGKQRGKAVHCKFTVPVVFKLAH